MIIKILSSALNFAGINYNERKNDAGKSELLCAVNFGGLSFQTDLVKADYINYMKAIGSLNPRVRNKQFHAVISVKGRSMPADKLMNVGVQYLEKMGYGNNPYLIYHHADTDNTHIHLVSTRVDKNGKKVDDSFEKIRSQKVMHEILSRDPLYEADTSISNALKYTFSTEAQFKLLLELQGFKVRESGEKSIGKPEGWEIIKYGVVQRILDPDSIAKRIGEYQFNQKRVSQLKAICLKYSVGLSEEQWVSLMKEKFGIDLVFHRKHIDDKPYGYTVVDHAQKNVFKGSQLLRLSELYTVATEDKVLRLVKELAAKPGLSFHDLQVELANLGLSLNQKGNIPVGVHRVQLTSGLYTKLLHADRLRLASTFKINDPTCKMILGKLLLIKPSDISSSVCTGKEFEAIKAVILYLDQQQKWNEGLRHFNFSLLRSTQHVYLYSASEPALLRLDKLLDTPIAVGLDQIPEVESLGSRYTNLLHHTSKDNLLSALMDIMAESQQKPVDQKNKKRTHQHKPFKL